VALRLTQQDLAAAAGVSLGTWKKFVRTGQGSLRMVAAVAQALRCPGSLADLFPAPEVRSLDEVLRQPTPRKRVRHEGQRTERTP
jgi:transcriptional regulator with XRE-family HTH domain